MDVADFHVIEDDHVIAADTVEAHTEGCAEVTMDAMDAETAKSSDHLVDSTCGYYERRARIENQITYGTLLYHRIDSQRRLLGQGPRACNS